MFSETPKLIHAALTAFICIMFIAFCGYTENPRLLLAWKIGAFIFALLTVVITGLIVLEAINRRVSVMTDFIHAFAKLDDEGRAAVAFEFPSMRYHMKKGVVREYFEDTNVSLETFRLFLQTSNEKYISPEREWNSAEKPRWAWLEIKGWLVTQGYVIEDSYAGNHSWLWRGNSYRHLMAYWLAGRKVLNLSEVETA